MGSLYDMHMAGTWRYHDRIRKEGAPLLNLFNIKHYGFFKVNYSGSYFFFGSHIEFSEYFIDEKFHVNYPYFRNPKFIKEGISLPYTLQNQEFSKNLSLAKNRFGIHDSLLLIKKSKEGFEAFGFCLDISSESQIGLLLQELPLLKLFTKKFRGNNQSIFSHMEDCQVNLIDLLGPAFNQNCLQDPPSHARELLLKQMKIEIGGALTPREVEILRLLLKGYSAGQTARQLSRSHRTVEHHIERIKMKLLCSSKSELIQKAKELESISFWGGTL